MRKLAFSFMIASMAVAAGCGDSGSGGGGGSGGEAAGGEAPGGGGGGTGGTPSDAGFCTPGCEAAADCCAVGAMDCPGAYPNDWSCDEGVCNNAGCSDDEDCTFGGVVVGFVCSSEAFCIEECAVDDDCTAPATCTGDDGGTMYCVTEVAPFVCETDDDCFDGVCDVESGACGCEEDADCTVAGNVCATF